MSRQFVRRLLFMLVLVPLIYFGAASASFLYRVHAENSDRNQPTLQYLEAPSAHERLLIISPHPDDETLGCAGLMQQAKAAGAHVHVAVLTNGDGFRVALEMYKRDLSVQPADYIRFAEHRQVETRAALAAIGLGREDATFLGYPDRGLLPMWNDYWQEGTPYISPYTRQSRSPYPHLFRPGSVYAGASLLRDLVELMRAQQPTDLYVPHPSDDHPDHAAASAFAVRALDLLRSEGTAWARSCRIHYYLIHRGDWPVPRGLKPYLRLTPPGEMSALDTLWRVRPLTEAEVNRKAAGISAYESQTAIMSAFLNGFVRRNELFGSIPEHTVPRVRDHAILLDGNPAEWRNLAPVALDPVNDNLLRNFQRGGDVRAIHACRDSRHLYLRIETAEKPLRPTDLRLRLRFFKDDRPYDSLALTMRIPPGRSMDARDIRTVRYGDTVEVALPLRVLEGASSMACSVETRFAGVQIDRTGIRFVRL